jgi:hypothetical protein
LPAQDLTNAIATDTYKYFNGWIGMGPTALLKTIMEYGWCSRSWLLLPLDRHTCKEGLTLLPSSAFSPLPGPLVPDLMLADKARNGETVARLTKNSYAIHLNNQNLKGHRIMLNDNSVLGSLLKKHCPVTARLSGDEL